MENNETATQYDEALANAVEVFSIGELVAYACHLLQERIRDLQ